MERITSVKNELIKRLRTLKTKKGRTEQNLFLVEGEKSVKEALLWAKVEVLLTTHPQDWEGQETAKWVTPEVLGAVAATKTPQNVLAAVRIPKQKEVPEHGLLAALDGVQDPQNVGTIIRTAECAGAKACLLYTSPW